MPTLILTLSRSGLINAFADRPDSWYCVSIEDIMAADPDVFIIVEADWDKALDKISYLHNHTDFCKLRAVEDADYIKIMFSASTLGPRNGAAALDMVGAALHVITGGTTMNFQSGVDFFDDEMLIKHTASLRCPFIPKTEKVLYKDNDKIPAWGIALIVVACLLCVLFFVFAFGMYLREKQGKPIFVSMEKAQADRAAQQSRTADTQKEMELNQA